MTLQIKCRKCNGPHFTIKCTLNNTSNNTSNNNTNNIISNVINNSNIRTYDSKLHNIKNSKTYTVKISELPNDISEYEMKELLKEWGDIKKIKVLNYTDTSVVYIDFVIEKYADHFIKALHKTTFDNVVISVLKVN